MGIILLVLVFNLFLSFLVAKEGGKREIGFSTSFLLSFLFSPILGLLFVIASKRLEEIIIKPLTLEEKNQKYIKTKKEVEMDNMLYQIQDKKSKEDARNIIIFLFVAVTILFLLVKFKNIG
jgi:hypothetical protein